MTARLLSVTMAMMLATPAAATIADCDCQRIDAFCQASLSYDAKDAMLTIVTTAHRCAKVEYYVDNTPYSSLFNGGQEVEGITIFDKKGPPPEISYIGCKVCHDTALDPPPVEGLYDLDWGFGVHRADVSKSGDFLIQYPETSGGLTVTSIVEGRVTPDTVTFTLRATHPAPSFVSFPTQCSGTGAEHTYSGTCTTHSGRTLPFTMTRH